MLRTWERRVRARERSGRAYFGDKGAGAVWMLCCCAVIWCAALGFVAWGAAVVARHRAMAAADLGALAGAQRLLAGDVWPCETTARVVVAHRARLVDCVVTVDSVLVAVEVRPSIAGSALPPARARARAG